MRRRRPSRTSVLAWALWGLAVIAVLAMLWLDQRLRLAGRPDLAPAGQSGLTYMAAAMTSITVGAVLGGRRPRHPVGWLLLALGFAVLVNGVSFGYENEGLLARPGTLPGAAVVAAVTSGSLLPTAACLGFVLLLTPTGTLPSPRWRWWARIAAAAPLLGLVCSALLPFEEPLESIANPLAVPALADALSVVTGAMFVLTGITIPVAAWSLVVRFRRSRGVERQQLRWLALAAGLAAVVPVAIVVLAAAGHEAPLGWLTAGALALLPLATGAAILQYRLYDLDRIISRTAAYGLLTLLLGGGYAGVVLGLGQLAGRGSRVVVAAATLAVAAAFQPARRRVQRAVDRRFNRRRYDAARTIEGFVARVRQQVDLDSLTAELLAVVDTTMQPTRLSVWLRPSGPRA